MGAFAPLHKQPSSPCPRWCSRSNHHIPMAASGKGRRGRGGQAPLWGHKLDVVHITSAHVPSRRILSQAHTQLQEKLGNVVLLTSSPQMVSSTPLLSTPLSHHSLSPNHNLLPHPLQQLPHWSPHILQPGFSFASWVISFKCKGDLIISSAVSLHCS